MGYLKQFELNKTSWNLESCLKMILKNKFVLMKNVQFKRKAQSSQLFLHDLFC